MPNPAHHHPKKPNLPLFSPQIEDSRSPSPIMQWFKRSITTSCITVWYRGCTASCRKGLQRIVNTARKIVGSPLPSLSDLYQPHFTCRATSIAWDNFHPSHISLNLLPSGERYRSLWACSRSLLHSFMHQAVRTLCAVHTLCPLLLDCDWRIKETGSSLLFYLQ